MSGQRAQGRRVAERPVSRRRFSPTLVVGVAAIAVAAASLAVQNSSEDASDAAAQAPSTRPLTSLSMLCPAGVSGSPDLVVGSGISDGAGQGEVTSRPASSENTSAVDLDAGATTTVGGTKDAVVVTGSGSLAPGLFGARFGAPARPAAGECATPANERWFVGAGAGGPHESLLVLANPDTGPAVADVTLWSPTGELVDVASRGLTLPGQRSSVLDLAELAPNRDELAVRVTVSRGRVAATMSDSYAPLGEDPVADWLPSAASPAMRQSIPGLPRAMDEPVLSLVNPGQDAGRVTIKVVGKASTFTPRGVDDIRVPAGQAVSVDLPRSLVALLAEEDVTLQLDSTVPITGSLRAVVAGDLVHLPAGEPVASVAAAAVPGGRDSVVVLTASDAAGRVTLTFHGGKGKQVQVRLKPGTSTAVPVPPLARAVVVRGTQGYVGAVRTVTAGGSSLLPLRPLRLEQLIPAVRPEWP